jgi:hypothetical protein
MEALSFMSSQLFRNQSEIERSASEASKLVLKPLKPAEIDRYLNPPCRYALRP